MTNPADFYMDIVTGTHPPVNHSEWGKEAIINHVVNSWDDKPISYQATPVPDEPESHNENTPYEKRTQASILTQFFYCVARDFTKSSRAWDVILSDALLMCVAGLALGMLFQGVPITKVPNVDLFISLATGFAATQQSLRLFGEERVNENKTTTYFFKF